MDESRTRDGNGNPLQYSCLGNPMDRRASWAAKTQTRRSEHTAAAEPECSHSQSRSLDDFAQMCLFPWPLFPFVAWKV